MAEPWNPIVDSENKMATQGFARIPWSFRTLIHKVLTYREAAVYLQIAMHCGKDEVYHWGLDEIAGCLGWKRTNAIYACLNKLVDTGFLLKEVVPLPGVRKYRVNVYQRPSVGYTLTQLQRAGYVGPAKSIHPDEFAEAYKLYEERDKPREAATFHFEKDVRPGVIRIGTKKRAPRSI